MAASLSSLFIAFLRANILGYGGGPATVPLVEAEVVDRFGWLTREEFAQMLAVGNSLPGPIATKMAAYVGYQVAGWPGALSALLATVAPTVVMIIGLFAVLQRFSRSPAVQGMLRGVEPVVWVLFVTLVLDYVSFVRSASAAVVAVAAFVAVYVLKLHPAVVMVLGLVAGALFLRPDGQAPG